MTKRIGCCRYFLANDTNLLFYLIVFDIHLIKCMLTFSKVRDSGFLFLMLVLCFFGGCIYLVVKESNKKATIKNEKWCSLIIFFNHANEKFDTTYSTTTLFGEDSIVNFTTPSGKIWWAKDFVINEERNDDDGVSYNDITLRSGERYKLTSVSIGNCQSEAIEDSLSNDLIRPDNNDSN